MLLLPVEEHSFAAVSEVILRDSTLQEQLKQVANFDSFAETLSQIGEKMGYSLSKVAIKKQFLSSPLISQSYSDKELQDLLSGTINQGNYADGSLYTR